ncbi:MAG TPA: type II CAAX endopeptidase family protein [Microlunatus sp.]
MGSRPDTGNRLPDGSSPVRAQHGTRWRVVAGVEVALATVAVILDLAIPTVVILGLMVVSLVIRRDGLSTMGFHRVARPWVLAGTMFACAAAWSLLNIAVLKPVVNHLSGTTQDMSQFMGLQGDLTKLLTLVAVSWTLAALGEEVAFRGFVLTRMSELVGSAGIRLALAVALTSILMGLLHTEYGLVGVVTSAVDSIFYSVLRYRYRTLWASILAHGFINTIGLVTFFVIGPVYGLW